MAAMAPEYLELGAETPRPTGAGRRRRAAAAACALFGLAGAVGLAAWRAGRPAAGTAARVDEGVEAWAVPARFTTAAPTPAPTPAPAAHLPWRRPGKPSPAATPAPATAAPTPAPGPKLREDGPLRDARSVFSQPAAEAFAALAKVAYCGAKPGVFASAAQTCSKPTGFGAWGTVSACGTAGFEVVPGFVRAFAAADDGRPDAIFGYLAKVRPTSKTSTVKPGVIIVFRGSVDNMANEIREKETSLVPTNHTKGMVHKGVHETYHLVEAQIKTYLQEFACTGADCTLYFTGHGSGAAVAQFAIGELASLDHAVGPSYLFSSPMVGNAAFANSMDALFRPKAMGPIFEVVEGKESEARWPYDTAFRPWGIQAYYSDPASKKVSVICYSDDPACGINAVPKAELTHQSTCKSALAPAGNICDFGRDFQGECIAGIPAETQKQIRKDWMAASKSKSTDTSTDVVQPMDEEAQTFHPSQSKGNEKVALENTLKNGKPEDYFNLDTLKAVSLLAKIAFCGPRSGVKDAILSSCNGQGSLCEKAGFRYAPDSLQLRSIDDNGTPEAYFLFTGLIHRVSARFAEAPYFVPAESCLLIIRGSAHQENKDMTAKIMQVPLRDPDCPGCTASVGVNTVWDSKMGDAVVDALKASGCTPQPTETTTNKITIAGHSMGGTFTTLAVYKLNKLGFDVQLSWNMAGARPGNVALFNHINNKMFADKRIVPMWLVTYWNDGITRWPQFFGRLKYHVHFEHGVKNTLDHPQFCLSDQNATPAGGCGIFRYSRDELDLEIPSESHCMTPYSPIGQQCQSEGVYPPFNYHMTSQCFRGGAMAI